MHWWSRAGIVGSPSSCLGHCFYCQGKSSSLMPVDKYVEGQSGHKQSQDGHPICKCVPRAGTARLILPWTKLNQVYLPSVALSTSSRASASTMTGGSLRTTTLVRVSISERLGARPYRASSSLLFTLMTSASSDLTRFVGGRGQVDAGHLSKSSRACAGQSTLRPSGNNDWQITDI